MILNTLRESYCERHSSREPDLLKSLRKETWQKCLYPNMCIGPLVGRLLSFWTKMIQPNNVLEIGTFTGYSTLCIAEGLTEGGKIVTLDINEQTEFLRSKYFKLSPYSKKIIYHLCNASNFLNDNSEQFDLVFLDADKENYPLYLDLLLNCMAVGSYLIVDNVLWHNKVFEEENFIDIETEAIKKFNNKLFNSPSFDVIMIPVRDGLSISRKIK